MAGASPRWDAARRTRWRPGPAAPAAAGSGLVVRWVPFYWMLVFMLFFAACGSPQLPQLLRLASIPPPVAAPGAPEPVALAAFEVPVAPGGVAVAEGIRLIGWRAGSDAAALGTMYRWLAGSEWDSGSAIETRHALVTLDARGRVLSSDRRVEEFRAVVKRGLEARRVAATRLGADEHDLDCIRTDVAGLRSKVPFMHDEIEGWEALEPRLREATAASTSTMRPGFWVCRSARTSHLGQFIFLDDQLQVVGSARYWIGE